MHQITLEQFKHAEVVRTRDAALLATLEIVVDVGGEYNPAAHRYDHHQRSFVDTFDANHDIRLSSAGLVYKHFGREVVGKILGAELAADPAVLELVYQRTYDNFVLALDGVDNGVSQYPAGVQPRYKVGTALPSRVGALNPGSLHGWDSSPRLRTRLTACGCARRLERRRRRRCRALRQGDGDRGRGFRRVRAVHWQGVVAGALDCAAVVPQALRGRRLGEALHSRQDVPVEGAPVR